METDNAAHTKPLAGAVGILLLAVLGAQTMILELAFPRLIAPAFGNTLFAWTAIIAVVLTALASGYALGGHLAKRREITGTASALAIASAVWVLGLSLLGGPAVGMLAGLDLMLGPLAASVLLAAVPALLAAAVVPLVVAARPDAAGRAAGTCFAWSTAGSILGVLATGYLLLPRLGIAGSLQVGAGLVVLALLLGLRARIGLVGLGLLSAAIALAPKPEPDVLYAHTNAYHQIRVVAEPGQGARVLYLDSTVEGAMLPGSINPGLAYQRAIGKLSRAVPTLRRAFFIGGGSFSMPKYLHATLPTVVVDVAEVDPDVTTAARIYLELPDTLNVEGLDGRRALAQRDSDRYDLIVNDAFHGVRNVPFHLLTREFVELVRARLTPDGLYAVNIASSDPAGGLLHSVTKTLQGVFGHVTWFKAHTSPAGVTNTWILASRAPLTLGSPAATGATAQVLTDDDAPVEYLIASELLRSSR
ncbi:MAG: fused MFS/spermidine synthase [Gammaproteobacteria bacterium]|nr:fused MFS/spermidine synthase [Gammaproteobacteria bacterium]